MKKTIISLVMTLILVIMLFAACSAPADTAGDDAGTEAQGDQTSEETGDDAAPADDAAAEDEKFIGIMFPSTLVDRWPAEAEALKSGFEELGYKAEIQYGNEDATLQVKHAENFLSQGVDVLVICAVDTISAATIVEMGQAEGVPVIAYCRMIENCEPDAFVAEDNDMVGVMQGQYIVDNVDSGNIIILGGAATDSNGLLYRAKGVEVLQDKIDSGDYVVVADQYCDAWDPSEALKHVENALTQCGNDVAAILCPNDGLAGGAIEALAAQQLDGKVVVTGGDGELAAAKRILAGTQSMTVFKDSKKIAAAAVSVIDAMLKGEEPSFNGTKNNGTVDVPAMLVDMTVVTQDNIQEIFVDSGYFTEEELEG